jgi:CheY-like chemotaxis protein
MSDGAEPVRALVAHTEQSSRDYFVAALAGWGCSVRAAATVHDTVTQIARGDIELVLLDPAMIERNLAEFRQEWAALPAPPRMIAIDPPSVSADAGQFLRETAAVVLPPPVDLPHLRAATLAALRRPI